MSVHRDRSGFDTISITTFNKQPRSGHREGECQTQVRGKTYWDERYHPGREWEDDRGRNERSNTERVLWDRLSKVEKELEKSRQELGSREKRDELKEELEKSRRELELVSRARRDGLQDIVASEGQSELVQRLEESRMELERISRKKQERLDSVLEDRERRRGYRCEEDRSRYQTPNRLKRL